MTINITNVLPRAMCLRASRPGIYYSVEADRAEMYV